VRGFILAAGLGTRLRPIADHVPKALVGVGGQPLLERALSFLLRQGIATIGVNSHHLAGQIAGFQKNSSIPFTLFHEKETIRGTGGGLYFAREFLAADEFFFVCNVDILFDFDLKPLIERFQKTDWQAGLLAVPAAGLLAAPCAGRGTIVFDPDTGLLTGVAADGKINGRGADFIGAALYRREFLDTLLPDDFSVVSVWKRAGARGHGVGVLMMDRCYWRDIGTPESLAGFHFDLLDGKTVFTIPGTLHLDRTNKRCYPASLPESLKKCIGSHAWVETSDIPPDSSISRSVIYAGASIRPQTTVENRIITPFCEVEIVR
jgi:NDP-sugar pyrophosphorylase family protein